MILHFISTLLLFSFVTSQWSPASPEKSGNITIASFKNDAAGAYTIIHDDFGGPWASGIGQYADTIAFNRGLSICFAVITGQCQESDWKRAREMINHGHQVLNHSSRHLCGKQMEWCSSGNWDASDFDIEIDSSTMQIERNTGLHPAFFMFPYDLYTDTMLSYLQSKHYAGARAGRWGLENPEVKDPFHFNYSAHAPEQTLEDLNSTALKAVHGKGWAIKEVHGVDDSSWGAISLRDYTSHMNYLKALSDSNQLWVATLSDVFLYSLLKEKYNTVPVLNKNGVVEEIKFSVNKRSRALKNPKMFQTTLQTSNLRNITLVYEQEIAAVMVRQNGKSIPYIISEGRLLMDVNPEYGPIQILYN